jgi:hypothetical protein
LVSSLQRVSLDPKIRLSKQTGTILAALAVQQGAAFHWKLQFSLTALPTKFGYEKRSGDVQSARTSAQHFAIPTIKCKVFSGKASLTK